MTAKNSLRALTISAAVLAVMAVGAARAQAHCDGLDGPVVKAAQRALAEGNLNHVLIWVQKEDASEIKHAFEKTLAVRKLNAEAKELADLYFFETVVRIHRAGEGASYTGLKPAGRDLGPAIPAGDKALETGDVAPVAKLLAKDMERGLREHFKEAVVKKKFEANDVAAGRAFVKAYVKYIHYVEGLHEATGGSAHGHSSGAEATSAHHR
jgi:hypothetical protein